MITIPFIIPIILVLIRLVFLVFLGRAAWKGESVRALFLGLAFIVLAIAPVESVLLRLGIQGIPAISSFQIAAQGLSAVVLLGLIMIVRIALHRRKVSLILLTGGILALLVMIILGFILFSADARERSIPVSLLGLLRGVLILSAIACGLGLGYFIPYRYFPLQGNGFRIGLLAGIPFTLTVSMFSGTIGGGFGETHAGAAWGVVPGLFAGLLIGTCVSSYAFGLFGMLVVRLAKRLG